MALSKLQRIYTAAVLASATDAYLAQPLWNFPPHVRSLVIAERNKRGMNPDPEPIGDPEYS